MVNISSVSSQKAFAKIVNVTYPKVIPEARFFNLTVSIQNFGNATETFIVRVVHSYLISIQREVIIPESSLSNVTFELRLLLSTDLRIEVFLHNQLVDSLSFFVEVPTPETDIGLLMIELAQMEITVVGVTLAALAIFATTYIRVRNKWRDEKLELIEKLKKQPRKFSQKEKRIIECTYFLLQGDYSECLRHFLDITTARKTLSKIVNLEKEETSRLDFESVKKSTIAVAFVLLIAVSIGFTLIVTAPFIVDVILFLYPVVGGRDILLSLYFVPLTLILLWGIYWLIYENYWEELGRFHRLLSMLCGISSLLVVIFLSVHMLFFCILGFSLGMGLVVVRFLIHKHAKGQKSKVLFQRELSQIKQLKEKLRKLHEKSSVKFEREEENLRQRFNKQLGHFEFAFKLIEKSMALELQRIEAEHSFDLVSEKRYEKLYKYSNSVARNAERLVSEISTKTDFNRDNM